MNHTYCTTTVQSPQTQKRAVAPMVLLMLSLAIGTTTLPLVAATSATMQSSTASNTPYQQRLLSVQAMVTAQQRLQGEQPPSNLSREGTQLLAEANEAEQRGDNLAAAALLEQAYQLTKMSILELAKGRATPAPEPASVVDPSEEDRAARAFDRLSSSVNALLSASQRISGEYANSGRYQALIEAVEDLRIKAQRAWQDDRSEQGLAQLQQAYFMLQGALTEMRDGITVSALGAQKTHSLPAAPSPSISGSKRVDRKQYNFQQRLASVNALLDAKQRLQQMGPADCVAIVDITPQRQRIIDLYQQGCEAEAYAQLDQAYRILQDDIRTLEQGRSDETESSVTTHLQDKAADDFNRFNQSVRALLDAQQRIMADVPDSDAFMVVAGTARSLQKVAMTMHLRGADQEGIRFLKSAYISIQDAIITMRGGQTLVRELNFTNAEDEYLYEVERNTGYQMLVELWATHKDDLSEGTRIQMVGYMDEAQRLVHVSQKQMLRKEFSEAVKSLEQSAEQMTLVLRAAGVAIPD